MDTIRRDLIVAMTSAAGIATFGQLEDILHPDSWERLLKSIEKPGRTDEATLVHLETLTDLYWELYRSAIAKVDLWSGVSGHLLTITRLLKTSQPVGVQYRLCSLVSNVAQILGEISYDLDQIKEAERYYQIAARTAGEVNNRALEATALGRQGFLPVYKGSPVNALPTLQQAYQLAQEGVTGKTKAWVLMMEAEALARIPEKKQACLSLLQQVEVVFAEGSEPLDQGANRDDRKWTGFNQATLNGYKGTCLLYLHEPDQARGLLQIALDNLAPGPMRRRSLLLTDLAVSFVQSQDVEQACDVATEALICTAQAKSLRSLQRLKSFQQQLGAWQDLASVKKFNRAMKMVESV